VRKTFTAIIEYDPGTRKILQEIGVSVEEFKKIVENL